MKDVPYFQCYAANLIADKHFRMMSLLERGLWISILLDCWPNKGVPATPSKLAKYFGFDVDEIKGAMSDDLMTFFKIKDDVLYSPELDNERAKYLEQRQKQSIGGKFGATRKKSKAQNMGYVDEGRPEGQPVTPLEGSLGHIKSSHINSNQLIDKEVSNLSNSEWVNDYDCAPEAEEYLKGKGR